MIESTARFMPIIMWPMTAPVKPKGIADIIISGCKYDLNGTAKSTYTTKSANAKFLNNELRVSLCSLCSPSKL